jgi:hypothetical protein
MLTFQCVTKSAKKIYHSSSKSIKLYVASLLLSAGKKNCTSMSSSCSVSYMANLDRSLVSPSVLTLFSQRRLRLDFED